MNILDLISNETGFYYKKKTAKEFGGPCPFCPDHGRDRFSILPDETHWVCRRCRQAGDAIGFIMKYKSLTYKKALSYALSAGMQINTPYTPLDRYDSSKPSIPPWEPRDDTKPSAEWQEKASAQLFQAYKFLLSANWEARAHRRWLNARGISDDLIKSARLGWTLTTATFSRESWALAPELTQKGKNKQIWMPSGLILPYFCGKDLIRLRIRQDNPTRGDRFIMVPGSSMNFMEYGFLMPDVAPGGGQGHNSGVDTSLSSEKLLPENLPVFLVEAELDGLLLQDRINQLAPGRAKVYAIGNSSTRPNQAAHDVISKASKILMCLDNDEAGDTETVWYRHQYIRAKDCRIPKEYGKDPGEAYENGFDFAPWLDTVLLLEVKPAPRPPDIPAIEVMTDSPPAQLADTTTKSPPQEQEPELKKALDLMEDLPDPDDPAEIARMGHFCLHGHYCGSAKDNICLRTKLNFFTMDECPGQQWYRKSEGPVGVIILGAQFNARQRGR